MPRQLVVIDPRVANYQSLIDQVGAVYSSLIFSDDSDGATQIAKYVAANPGFDAVCLVPRGSPPETAVGPTPCSLPAFRSLDGLIATQTFTPTESIGKSNSNWAECLMMRESGSGYVDKNTNSSILVGLNIASPTRNSYLEASQIGSAFHACRPHASQAAQTSSDH